MRCLVEELPSGRSGTAAFRRSPGPKGSRYLELIRGLFSAYSTTAIPLQKEYDLSVSDVSSPSNWYNFKMEGKSLATILFE